jgi:DNA recombination protein RmuC
MDMLILEMLGAAILIAVIINIVLTVRKAAPAKNEIVDEVRASRAEMSATVQTTMKNFADSLTAAQSQTAERQDVRLKELTESVSKNQDLLKADVAEKLLSLQKSQAESILALQKSVTETTAMLSGAQEKQFGMQDKRLQEIAQMLAEAQAGLKTTVSDRLKAVDEQFRMFTAQNKESLDGIRTTVQSRLEALQADNNQQLEKMRATVDEKLQKTLDDRITQSFKLVSDRLQEVYAGLGEMKTLANGVGDLKKVLSNVKTRGIVGEYQLGAIIEELLTKEQYEENVATKRGSANRVEYAIKLPGEGDRCVYLPIDAKFPGDTYSQLVDAYESGDSAAIAVAQAGLEARIKGCAKDIRDKYIDPPYTTDFAIMFLPFEGLYAEVVRKGLVDTLQRQYRINIAGPTTFAALLNSLQMGFRTLAIQKRSGEVWNVLGAVKTEFMTFETVLSAAQKRIEQTHDELDKLVGVRTRKINSKLREIQELPALESRELLDTAPESDE